MIGRPEVVAALGCLWLALGVGGCGASAPDVLRDASRPVAPAWLDRVPRDDGYVYAVGSAHGGDGLVAIREAAEARGRVQLAATISARVKSELALRASSDARQDSAEERVFGWVRGRVEGAEVVDEYWRRTILASDRYREERLTVYVLVRLSKARIRAERTRLAAEDQRRLAEAAMVVERAEGRLKTAPLAALTLLESAGATLAELDPALVTSDGRSAADVQRRRRAILTPLVRRSRGVQADLHTGLTTDPVAVRARLGRWLGAGGLTLDPRGRFRARLRLSPTSTARFRRGLVTRVAYAFELIDLWADGRVVSSRSGVQRGFGRTVPACEHDALDRLAPAVEASVKDATVP